MPDLVEALYAYQPQSPDDMALQPGHRIEVQEHLSSDWARGKNLTTGQTGVFPKNYVKLVPSESRDAEKFNRPAAAVPPQATGNSAHSGPQPFDNKQQYEPPQQQWQGQAPPQYYPPQQQQQYYPPQQQQYQPPQQQYQPPQQQMMPPQEQPQQQQQQQGGGHHGAFGNIAKRFGDSMVFGAGATLGSDLINKIF